MKARITGKAIAARQVAATFEAVIESPRAQLDVAKTKTKQSMLELKVPGIRRSTRTVLQQQQQQQARGTKSIKDTVELRELFYSNKNRR